MDIKLKINADIIGAGASTLCTIHCLATPFLFLSSTCTKSCCSATPSWWLWIDYAFLLISFFAVYKSTRTTSKFWIKPTLWISWTALFTFIIIEHNLNLSNIYKYSAALSLAGFHIYNMKYCKCKSEQCCTKKN